MTLNLPAVAPDRVVAEHTARFDAFAAARERGDEPRFAHLVSAAYRLGAELGALCQRRAHGRRPVPALLGAWLGEQSMVALGRLRRAPQDRLGRFWLDLVDRPATHSVRRPEPRRRAPRSGGDELLTSEHGSFCVEFDLPATDLAELVFWQLRQFVTGRRDDALRGTPFRDGRTHVALGHRDVYAVGLLCGGRIAKLLHDAAALQFHLADDLITPTHLALAEDALLRALANATVQRHSTVLNPVAAHDRPLPHHRREELLTDPARPEVADLRITLLDSDLPLDVVQHDPRALTVPGTPVVLALGPIGPQGRRRIVAKFAHAYTDGAMAVEEARRLGRRPRHTDGRTDRLADALRSRTMTSGDPMPAAPQALGAIASGILDRYAYQDRLTALHERGLQHPGGCRLTIHLVMAQALLLITQRESLHFLEAVRPTSTLAPSLLRVPTAVLEAMRTGARPTPELRELLVAALRLWELDRSEVQAGRGVIPLMAAVTGALRRPLELAGRFTDPRTSADISDTLLLSTLVHGRRVAHRGGTRVLGFSSALATAYSSGVCGAIDSDDGTMRVSIRTSVPLAAHGVTSERLTTAFEAALTFLEELFALPYAGRPERSATTA